MQNLYSSASDHTVVYCFSYGERKKEENEFPSMFMFTLLIVVAPAPPPYGQGVPFRARLISSSSSLRIVVQISPYCYRESRALCPSVSLV